MTFEHNTLEQVTTWVNAGHVSDFPENGGSTIFHEGDQIAVFNFKVLNKWFATQNLCPHKKQMILSRGIIGTEGETPKVACPYHKKTFSLETGENLNGCEDSIETFPIKIEDDTVFVGLYEKK
ncbi:nitrite reductase small subunit NirD [Flammeovirga kamogawensis]|uniref:Nitrite reductase small subunit NirD n=1 Tax=Flammeovirga kamogawensis TaxID=373891 RepID=A0ABX8GUX1_9BACT|nr:nitrite reductase small subunit NirD [Flammeovirga kamogawensis]MBB6461680.1 nitrite reductase (NADH) small subunit [Flammeovirga kamogawensis]QWG07395.1 nitrite reductase small subunit NirD [Flammeovirga kamogawensis]TRX69208.1 nitrite reductase small subunit NirD [Flammeovirga kamogawensis]